MTKQELIELAASRGYFVGFRRDRREKNKVLFRYGHYLNDGTSVTESVEVYVMPQRAAALVTGLPENVTKIGAAALIELSLGNSLGVDW